MQRPSSDELLHHSYIHSARMAQFIKDATVHVESDPLRIVTRSVTTPFEATTKNSSSTITTPTSIPLLLQRNNPTMKSNSQSLRRIANYSTNSSNNNVSLIPTSLNRQRIYAIDSDRLPAKSIHATNKMGKKEAKYSASLTAASISDHPTLIPQSKLLGYKKRRRNTQQATNKSKTPQMDSSRGGR